MSYYPVTGSKFFVSSGFASAKTISAVTNAAPPVCTSTAHGYSDLDEVLIATSGWEDLAYSMFRVNQLTTDTFECTGFDATDTDWYPAGSGAGTATKVSGWTELGQVLGVTASGGDPKNITVSPLNRRTDILIPVGFNPSSLQFELGFDPALADQVALATASRSLDKRAFKFTLPGSAYAYCYGTVSMAPIPTFDTGSVMRRTVNISIDGLFTFFTA